MRPRPCSTLMTRMRGSSASGFFAPTGAATKAILSESRLIESVRDMIAHVLLSFGFVRERIQQAVSQIGVNYRTSPIVHEAAPYDPDPKAGDRARKCRRAQSIFPAHPPPTAWAMPSANPTQPMLRSRPHPPGRNPTQFFLIRPDGYIGLRCQGGDVDALRRYMSGIVRF